MSLSNTILVLLIYMIVGFLSRKFKLIDDDLNRGLSNILVSLTLPCSIIASLQIPFSNEILRNIILMFFLSFVFLFLNILIGYITSKIFKIAESKKNIWIFVIIFSNAIFLGKPVLEATVGEESLYLLFIFSIPFNIICFTFGVFLMQKGYKEKKKINLIFLLKNNAIVANIIGIILFLLQLRLPDSIGKAIFNIGNMTTPLAMIILGVLVARTANVQALKDPIIYLLSFIRLIIMPLITLLCFNFLNNKEIVAILVIISATPAASLAVIFAKIYNQDLTFTSKVVYISTILSIVTIPLVVLVLDKYVLGI